MKSVTGKSKVKFAYAQTGAGSIALEPQFPAAVSGKNTESVISGAFFVVIGFIHTSKPSTRFVFMIILLPSLRSHLAHLT